MVLYECPVSKVIKKIYWSGWAQWHLLYWCIWSSLKNRQRCTFFILLPLVLFWLWPAFVPSKLKSCFWEFVLINKRGKKKKKNTDCSLIAEQGFFSFAEHTHSQTHRGSQTIGFYSSQVLLFSNKSVTVTWEHFSRCKTSRTLCTGEWKSE